MLALVFWIFGSSGARGKSGGESRSSWRGEILQFDSEPEREELAAEFLAVKNWSKFQPANKNGKRSREWIRVDTRLEDDPDFLSLSFFERSLLQGIWRLTGATGRNIPHDVGYIRRALGLSIQEASSVHRAIADIISIGFLTLTNQQEIENVLPISSTGRDGTLQDIPPIYISPKSSGKKTSKKSVGRAPEYTQNFEEFWKLYPPTNGSKAEAFKAWAKQENGSYELIMRRIREYVRCPQWIDGFIPHAATWINQKRWETAPSMKARTTNGKRDLWEGIFEPDDPEGVAGV